MGLFSKSKRWVSTFIPSRPSKRKKVAAKRATKKAGAKVYRNLDRNRLLGAVSRLCRYKLGGSVAIAELARDVKAPVAVVRARLEKSPAAFPIRGQRVYATI